VPAPPVDVPDTGVPPVDDVITRAEAILDCTRRGILDDLLTPNVNEFLVCVQDTMT